MCVEFSVGYKLSHCFKS